MSGASPQAILAILIKAHTDKANAALSEVDRRLKDAPPKKGKKS